MVDKEIIFEKVYSKPVLHFLHRDGKIFRTTADSFCNNFDTFLMTKIKFPFQNVVSLTLLNAQNHIP